MLAIRHLALLLVLLPLPPALAPLGLGEEHLSLNLLESTLAVRDLVNGGRVKVVAGIYDKRPSG